MRASSRVGHSATPTESRQRHERGVAVNALFIDHAFVKIMRQAVAAIFLQNKIECATTSALDVLGNLAAMHMNEICRKTRLLLENSGRSKVTAHDVEMACRDLEIFIGDLCDYIQRFLFDSNYPYIPEPRTIVKRAPEVAMHIGDAPARPSHIPSFLPPFPDPHTYIRTPINIEPDISYVRHRELCAKNKRDTDYTLITYFTTRHPTVSLFRKYEEDVRAAARDELRRREERRKERIEARVLALRRQRLERDLSLVQASNLPEDFLEEDHGNQETNNYDIVEERNLIEDEIRLEELTETQETENSLVRRKLRPAFQIFLPFKDDRPYLNALLPFDYGENKEKDKNFMLNIDKKVPSIQDGTTLMEEQVLVHKSSKKAKKKSETQYE
ncbi:unnamed protein product [Bursaphelenchus okinawaensis]|uniref:Transcription initiation factor TFIID subunit 8 n=1 Tax=Bursaphelenchus okinawaensis TaxID=465554 RepID=A0A811KXH3_9BILA|nr:unnamed protein product [Bursaphelenchus okinawaensis]CAG9113842.1 unnamed protein product [Bursaphelenchus okinawaensis]